jgi:O-antigen/teichoic acid export membrane protein
MTMIPDAVHQRLRWIRFTPFDTATVEGLRNERNRLIALGAVSSMLSKVLGLAAALVSIPMALSYLGTERFGVWSTLSSLVMALQFADLGIGNGVINSVADAHGKGDREAVRRCLSSALLALGAISLLLMFALPALVFLPDWASLFKLKSTLTMSEVKLAIAMFWVCIALAVPLGLVQRAQIGLQKGYLASLWQCISNLLSILAIWGATRFELGLPWLVLALLGAPLLSALVNGALFFFRTERDLLPLPRLVTAAAVRRLLSKGGEFFILQIACAAVMYSDSLIIVHVLGAERVAEYALPDKLFSVVPVLLSTILAPLWPAYGEAIARGDFAWTKRIFKRSLVLCVSVATLASVFLALLGPWLIHAWVGGQVPVNQTLLWALGLWKLVECAGLALAMLFNGAGLIRMQIVSACLMGVASLTVKPYMVVAMGVEGAPIATVAIYLTFALIPYLTFLPQIFRRLREGPQAT